jgi:hypothetical protein
MKNKKEQYAFKSKFEGLVDSFLQAEKGESLYEVDTLAFLQPAVHRKYKPDFKIADNVYVECKGIFSLEDRKKMLWIKEQHPEKQIYLLFYNAYQKLRKGSNTTYADWCDKHGFIWADWFRSGRAIPSEWFPENKNKKENNEY